MDMSSAVLLAATLGFNVAHYGKYLALGVPNGAGGVRAYQLGPLRAGQLVERLRLRGVPAALHPAVEPGKHIVTFCP